ncbi:hypothetical protein K402DRAFT_416899 [Aulographum hederae CBS 113979]|uniref:RING-type domain-containing protein n=1 Tax=Aulographum hederae CBS 113979 TaxID=1176131 RepID=A0A6G1HEM5_9PEZI|nr:hypothetical protein K402DRAFT_416899 [Aulographum hederae CBS 113979]
MSPIKPETPRKKKCVKAPKSEDAVKSGGITKEKDPKLLGKRLSSWRVAELQRMMSVYGGKILTKDFKRDMFERLQKIALEQCLTEQDVKEVSALGLDKDFSVRPQLVIDNGRFHAAAHPGGYSPTDSRNPEFKFIARDVLAFLNDAVRETDPEAKECTKCRKTQNVMCFPQAISAQCQHEVSVCNSCMSKTIRAEILHAGEGELDLVSCPQCGHHLDIEEVKPLVSKTTFEQYQEKVSQFTKN